MTQLQQPRTLDPKSRQQRDKYSIRSARSYPLGATVQPDGVNFAIFSKNSYSLELLLFLHPEDAIPFQCIKLDPEMNKSFYYWHIFVEDLKPGILYGYRIQGPDEPHNGHRFDASKLILDPYARAVVTPKGYERSAAIGHENNFGSAMKCVVVDPDTYEWEGDKPLHHTYAKSVIYELHVKGFTRHFSSQVTDNKRGTYAGLIEKIPYLKELGITTVEIMPVIQFDSTDVHSPELKNYWGYSPIAFFAPHNGYCYCDDPKVIADEFRNMVKALHKANIEVILDVVFNHTAEGNHQGPTLSFKGLENRAYYMLSEQMQYYMDFSGCGNTLNTNHSIVKRMIIDSLKRWVLEMHIDGFRFDLASVMSRNKNGTPLDDPPILWEIESHPVLSETKIIAEAWDTGGLYQLGSFIGDKWAEWNGKYRDDIRRFLRGDPGTIHAFTHRISGSPDLFKKPFRDPNRSINFITCHDGFTMNDLVSYNGKHNEANQEDNRDGSNDNYSCNYGFEGPTEDVAIEQLRIRQIKNLFTILLLSQGTPMFVMGDEVRRSQQGNNNAYCHDDELSWFDWKNVDSNQELFQFVQQLIQFNLSHEIFQMERFWDDSIPGKPSSIFWHGIKLNEPDRGENSHSIAYTLVEDNGGSQYHFMINAWWEPLNFEIPRGQPWYRIIDTFKTFPEDFQPLAKKPVRHNNYLVNSRSVVVLMTGG